tara:strand:- start:1120 stop:1563 length:444 start_codon:yes stop_codon:yes gene_type:complete
MKSKTKSTLLEIICLLFVVLFVYAAFSKIWLYSSFEVQVHQSPLLRSISNYAWVVLALELVIAALLIIPKYRLLGLYASLSIMTLFTTYLIVMLNFFDSKDIPCSCGGILNTIGWREHIYFNLFFVVISVIGIIISTKQKRNNYHLA